MFSAHIFIREISIKFGPKINVRFLHLVWTCINTQMQYHTWKIIVVLRENVAMIYALFISYFGKSQHILAK